MARQSEVDLELTRNFPQVSAGGVDAGNLEFCIQVVAQAKVLAPVDEGQLRNSTQYETSDGHKGGLNEDAGDQAQALTLPLRAKEAAFGSTANYSVYQEFGTRKQSPQPYLRPAIAIVAGQDINEITRKIEAEIARGVLRAGVTRETFV